MDITKAVDDLRAYWFTQATRPYEFRAKALEDLYDAIEKNEDAIFAAMKADLGKVAFESYASEVGLVLDQIKYIRAHLKEWMKPEHVHVGLAGQPGKGRILRQPYGVALIMAPWNYPFMLTMEPLVGAIAGGNTVLVQPSDYSPHTSQCIADIISQIYKPEYVNVVLGGHHENPTLLDHHFDYIFFTGSTRVGKIVQQAAANYCTPVTLELGGQSPCILDATAKYPLAGERIAYGKVLNSGQTCVAPDYVYVPKSKKDELLDALNAALDKFYPKGALEDPDYPHMIREEAYERVVGLMKDATIARGGKTDEATMRIEPTILTDVTWDSPCMSEEIFGPLLPIMEYDSIDDVIATINTKNEPLSCYVFTEDKAFAEKIETQIRYGGGCVNDTIMHVAITQLPFGGVGASGMGRYHGRHSFDTFTYEKGILDEGTWMNMSIQYPPYTQKHFDIIKKVLR